MIGEVQKPHQYIRWQSASAQTNTSAAAAAATADIS